MLDIHSHTKFSPDSNESPEALVERAIQLGCKVFGISEHLDYDYVANDMEVVLTDVAAYYESVSALRQKYGDRITILAGLECGYDRKAQGSYREIFEKYPFDYCINSVHIMGNKDLYFAAAFEGTEKKEAYRSYLKLVLESLDANYPYHIVGHIGYVSRNAPYADKRMRYAEFADLIDDILKKIISLEKAIEVNTNLRREGETLPPFEVVERYYELGGRLVTFGSDCHSKEKALDGYGFVSAGLKKIGFSELCYFEEGKLKLFKI